MAKRRRDDLGAVATHPAMVDTILVSSRSFRSLWPLRFFRTFRALGPLQALHPLWSMWPFMHHAGILASFPTALTGHMVGPIQSTELTA